MRFDLYQRENWLLRKIMKRKREEAGLRQSDLAEQTNRSQAYISKFENGSLRLDVVDFLAFCRVIGCNPHDVIDEMTTLITSGEDVRLHKSFPDRVEILTYEEYRELEASQKKGSS
ncbi:helix-turn-helix transcriptional regulator [Parasphingopyxis sp.]|uniref:helix-turn-helix domain-containing protein n=1 Tax=Parasphingopyxis sp. TaxID=1920299 RepID=UPI00261A460B|nr:helix-turn-helix transcriptional regulator [Parasphingopyxis sp.]